ncbi:MAG TPA: hypothetical protein VI916_01095 [Acidimicrobiia bacterium]|nr:hypothetical protein [Acidimicrobiia bacterium]
MRSFRPLLTGVLAAVALAPACNTTERVDLLFRAPEGSHARYTVAVDSEVITELVGPPERTRERVVLAAEQLVLALTDTEADLRISMTRAGERPRVFEVRLDPRGGLAEIDRVEGLPVEALGELGPSRLILLASGLLPGRPLRVGGEWDIERQLELPEGNGRLRGTGRLMSLRVEGGVDLARVRAETSLPVDRTLTLPEGRVRLSGTESTTATLDYVIDDGTVQRAKSITTGRFALVVTPPAGGLAPVEGHLTVRVESTTSRTSTATTPPRDA